MKTMKYSIVVVACVMLMYKPGRFEIKYQPHYVISVKNRTIVLDSLGRATVKGDTCIINFN